MNLLASDFLQRNTNPFNESRVSMRYPQLTLNAGLPLSEQRDYTDNSANGGGVTKVNAEYRLRATTTSGSIGSLITRQRANYLSGGELEGGIGLRRPTQPTGDAHIDWGFIDYDGNNALMFTEDATDIRLKLISNGVTEINKAQGTWNIDNLDGNGPSEYTMDLSEGSVFQIPFIYYGYGEIIFQVMVEEDGRRRMVDIHRVKRDGSVSINQPNLPLGVEVYSGTSGVQLDAYVGGRQMSSTIPDTIRHRFTSGRRIGQTVGTTDFVPLVSFKHKTGFEDIFCIIDSLEINTNNDLIIEIHRNGTLTGGTFAYTGNQTASEMALQYDIAATSITGGEMIYDTFAIGGQGNSMSLRPVDVPSKYISEFDTFSIVAKAKTTSATVDTIARNTEKW